MRPRKPLLNLLLALAAAGAAQAARAQDLPTEDLREMPTDWYRVELLVFVRDDAASLTAEQWAPLPTLAYPDDYRFLIDPALVEQRLAEGGAFASRIDGRGIQALTVPAPAETLDRSDRPDALINEPWTDEDAAALPGVDGTDSAGPGAAAGAAAPGADPMELAGADVPDDEPAPKRLLALPYELLGEDSLDFRTQARALRRRGERVLFHGSWWAPLAEGSAPLPLVLDRSADPDTRDWPALQGSVNLYRSRYLHIDVNLWLNTMASYLPEGWQIPAPPRPRATLVARTLAGEDIDPWAPPAAAEEDALPLAAPALEMRDAPAEEIDDMAPAAADEEAVAYPWRHAIVHRQSRRMRSGEIHYLDHPVIGVIVRLQPIDDTHLPLADDAERDFRERHGLPTTVVEDPDAPATP